MRRPNAHRGALFSIVIVGLTGILGIALVTKLTNHFTGSVMAVALPHLEGPTISPLPTPTPNVQESVGACSATLEAIQPTAALPTYKSPISLSEPKVVYTDTNRIMILEWLPGRDALLVAQWLPEKSEEVIATLNLASSELNELSTWHGSSIAGNARPIWVPQASAVAYVESERVQFAPDYDPKVGARLPVSGPSAISSYLALNSLNGSVIAVQDEVSPHLSATMVEREPQSLDLRLHDIEEIKQPLPVDVAKAGIYGLQVVPSPKSSAVALFARQLFLGDLTSGITCRLEMPTAMGKSPWVFQAAWSNDARYLAMIVTEGESVAPYAHLYLFDTTTNAYYMLDVGVPYVMSLSWSPSSASLIVTSLETFQDDQQAVLYSMYLVDLPSRQVSRLLENYPLNYTGAYGVVWSQDGTRVAFGCPLVENLLITQGRVCLSEVEVQQ